MKTQLLNYSIDKGWSDDFTFSDNDKTLIIVFGSSLYLSHTQPFKTLNSTYPQAKIVGCSTAGEILNDQILDDHLVVSITQFESTNLELHTLDINQMSESKQVGEELSKSFDNKDLKSIFILSKGLDINGTALIQGVNQYVDDQVVVTGGLAGDGGKFEQTWVLKNGLPDTSCVSAVGFYGNNLEVLHGSRGGWEVFGPKRKITRSTDNILYELDNQPALELYKDYLGKLAVGLPATGLRFPLLISQQKEEKSLVRTILAVDEDAQSMTFAGDVPENYDAQFMSANFSQLLDGAEQAAEMVKKSSTHAPALVIAISCIGRRMVLGEEAEEEVEAVHQMFGQSIPQIGFHSYGELSPYASGKCDLHNQTMTLTTFYERSTD